MFCVFGATTNCVWEQSQKTISKIARQSQLKSNFKKIITYDIVIFLHTYSLTNDLINYVMALIKMVKKKPKNE